jgi:chromate transporter
MIEATAKSSPAQIATLFLRLGLTAFGGPAAHIVLMEQEAVERRGWLTRADFLDLVGGCNLLPGPGSTQVAMALGYRRLGWLGLAIAGCCFILPSALTTLALAWTYVRYGNLPQAQGLLYGAKPVMVAIIFQAIFKLGQTAFKSWLLALLGLACLAAVLAGAPPLAVLLGAGALTLLLALSRKNSSSAMSLALLPLGGATGTAAAVGLLPIALLFLKLGVVVFGSGYVLLAFLKADLVDRLHWVTNSQLLDAVTAGQLTPGPVFATATFLGYLLHGFAGAAVATAAIFLPSFFMAGALAALASRLRKSPSAAAFLDGVNAAAIALMAAVAIALGQATFIDPRTAHIDIWPAAIALLSLGALLRFKLNATWLILAGAALGILFRSSGL